MNIQEKMDVICKQNNPAAFFRLMPELVRLSVAEWQLLKLQARKELGLLSRDINNAYGAELAKLKSTVAPLSPLPSRPCGTWSTGS